MVNGEWLRASRLASPRAVSPFPVGYSTQAGRSTAVSFAQGAGHVVEQLVDFEATWNEPLLRCVHGHELETLAVRLDAERERVDALFRGQTRGFLALNEQAENLLRHPRPRFQERFLHHDHVVDRHRSVAL